LDAAQKSYDKLITTQKFSDIQEGRAKVAVARARLELAINHRDTLLRGSDDLAVKAAQANLTHAQDMVTQAQAAKTQAETSLKQIDIQISKMQVKSPEDGVILERALEVGEIVTPGATTIVLGNLNPLKVTAYIPEDQYGRITLGMEATVTVDSFPNQTFTGKVTHIADKAEFTPRNVQTVEGRKTTVIAVDIEIPNPDMKLKPGMPADIVFIEK
jgi:RND family efflux transporter MFP subunit